MIPKITYIKASNNTSNRLDTLTYSMLVSLFFLASFANCFNSFLSFTKAFITLIPVKFSCA